MIDPKKRQEAEQGLASFCEQFPPMLWGLYQGLTKEGFSERQAFELVKAYLVGLTQCSTPPEAADE